MSNINTVIFDLDGVLVETKDLHWIAFNQALSECGIDHQISMERHVAEFDGLSTNTKLSRLEKEGYVRDDQLREVWLRKQKITKDLLAEIKPRQNIKEVFKYLDEQGIKIAVVSNAIRETVETVLESLQVLSQVSLILANEDVEIEKPHPAPYWQAMIAMKSDPGQTLILEDSAIGRQAALRSGANLMPITTPADVTVISIQAHLERKAEPLAWTNKKLNVLIPMAGLGSRFSDAGYTFPKPLIEVNKKPMIELVVKNLNLDANYIFIAQREVSEKYNLSSLLPLISRGPASLIELDGTTEGAAVTVLEARHLIDNDSPLLIANSDQVIDWDASKVMYSFERPGVDAGVVTFEATHPKWSFVRRGETGFVEEVAEKRPISREATVGIYFWSKGADFVRCADSMIKKNIRTNNEFYVAPVLNELIAEGGKVVAEKIEEMWGLGTPEDLDAFLSDERHKNFM